MHRDPSIYRRRSCGGLEEDRHSLRLRRMLWIQSKTHLNWIRVTPERNRIDKARAEEGPGLGRKVPGVSNLILGVVPAATSPSSPSCLLPSWARIPGRWWELGVYEGQMLKRKLVAFHEAPRMWQSWECSLPGHLPRKGCVPLFVSRVSM